MRHCRKPIEERVKEASTARAVIEAGNLERIGSYLFYTRGNPHVVSECTKVVDVKSTSVEQLLTDLQMKYRDNLDGTSVTDYLYSTSGKLALVKNFRDEAFGLLARHPAEQIKQAPLIHLKDFSSTDQTKYLYKFSNLPMNPTALN